MPELQVFLPNHQYTPHSAQGMIHRSDKRFRVAVMGRKFGKTEMAQREMMDYMGVPESIGWWAAPQYSITEIAWERLNNALNPKIIKSRSRRDHRITFINDSTLKFISTDNEKGLVGEGIDFLILEEASYIKEGLWLEKIRPNLGDAKRKGDCMMITTPSGYNWVFKEWMKGQDEKFLDYESWRYDFNVLPIVNEVVDNHLGGFPSWVNPYWRDLKTVIHQPRGVVLQEYGARFLQELSNVFLGVSKTIDREIGLTNKPDPTVKYYVGYDVARSGAGDNAVVIVVSERDYKGQTRIVVEHITVMKGKGLPYQVETVKNICMDWNEAPVLVDTTNPMGDSVYEFIEDKYPNTEGLHYTTKNKRDMIDNLSILIQTGKILIPNKNDECDELIKEMRMFGAGRNRDGSIKYEAPQGFYDDHCNALGLACWLIKEESGNWNPDFVIWS